MLCSGVPSLPEDGALSGQTRSTRTSCSTTPAATVRTGGPPRPWGAARSSVRAPVHSGLLGRAPGTLCMGVCVCVGRAAPDPPPRPQPLIPALLSALHAVRCQPLGVSSRPLGQTTAPEASHSSVLQPLPPHRVLLLQLLSFAHLLGSSESPSLTYSCPAECCPPAGTHTPLLEPIPVLPDPQMIRDISMYRYIIQYLTCPLF